MGAKQLLLQCGLCCMHKILLIAQFVIQSHRISEFRYTEVLLYYVLQYLYLVNCEDNNIIRKLGF